MRTKKLFSLTSDAKKINLLYLLTLFVFNVAVNSFMRIKLLYLDDLVTWSEFSKMPDLQMIFNTSANKFRPVYYFVLNLCYKIFLPRVYLFGIFTLMLNFLIIALIFYVIKKITDNSFIAFCGSVIYTVSRFAYYNISQVHGIMEQMALGVAVLILFLLWTYVKQNCKKYFYLACILLFIVPLIHERYMALYPLFLIALLLASKCVNFGKLKFFVLSSAAFAIPFFIRILFLKNRAFDGTGGTDMKETFKLSAFFSHFKSGIRYLLGQNAGPAYLNGIEQSNVSGWVNALNLVFIAIVLVVSCLYIFFLIKNRLKKDEIKNQIKLTILIISFIGLTLICSCATIRLEMRWLYTPFVGFIFVIANMISYLSSYINKNFCIVTLLGILCITIPTEMYFRSYYKNIYYWETYQVYNSLYDQLFTRYKGDLWNKKIFISSDDTDIFGENGEALQTSFCMIEPNKKLNVAVYKNVIETFEKYHNENENIILKVDSYNQKVVNLSDFK